MAMIFGYRPINYKQWNLDGTGRNIIDRLSGLELVIWNAALPYQDVRDDKGHAEITTYFAIRLLGLIGADRFIVVPAAILHDAGWSQLAEEKLKDFDCRENRLQHQQEGVKIARNILQAVTGYEKFIDSITEIISEHDTRKGFLSQEDGIVRDADKLWRYTYPHLVTSLINRKVSWPEYQKSVPEKIDKQGFFYSDVAKQIARIEYENGILEFNETYGWGLDERISRQAT